MYYTLLSLLFPLLPLCFSNSMPSYIPHTIYYAAVPFLETLVLDSPAFLFSYGYYLILHHPFFHAHFCSFWGKSLCPAMFLYLPPHILWQCHFLFSPLFSHLRAFPLLVLFSPISKTPWLFFDNFLSPQLLHFTLHYSTFQHFEPIASYHYLLLFLSTPTLLGKMPEPVINRPPEPKIVWLEG